MLSPSGASFSRSMSSAIVRALVLEVGGDIDEAGQLAQAVEQDVVPVVELGQVGVLQGVLVLGAGELPADADRRRVLQEDSNARHGRQLGAQARDDLVGLLRALGRAASG
jgi:hypothetical protein